MLVDILIVLLSISALWRGQEIGFARQLFSTVGFFGGLFLGAWLEPRVISTGVTQTGRALITLCITLGCGLLLMTIGEYIGVRLKYKLAMKRINMLDNGLGALLGVGSLLFVVWLAAPAIDKLPWPNIQTALQGSRIVSNLNRALPSAPTFIADLGRLIEPNGFPQVFTGREPVPDTAQVPSSVDLQTALSRDRASVVKVDGQGCGGIVTGSGFVVGSDLVATNAHVIAGIGAPRVEDSNGAHSTTTLWFDPNLDFALLRVNNLAGQRLIISHARVAANTPAVVLGYPGGGSLTAGSAAVLDDFTAIGRDIYGHDTTNRDVYEIRADILPGNSGGPLIAQDGSVIGLVFARSTDYQHIGYALTTSQVTSEINQAVARNKPVSTGRCAM